MGKRIIDRFDKPDFAYLYFMLAVYYALSLMTRRKHEKFEQKIRKIKRQIAELKKDTI